MITQKGKIITITFEGIEGGQKFDPLAFPPNKLSLTNGTQLAPTQDYPWFGLKKGQKFSISWDGEYVRAGGLNWSVDQLIEEIKKYSYWEVV